MKVVENIMIAMVALGLLFKFNHWPGAGFLLVFGCMLLSMLYFGASVFLFRSKEVKINELKGTSIWVLIASGLGLSTLLIATLFRIQTYPGALMNLYVSFGFLIIAVVTLFALRAQLNQLNYQALMTRLLVGLLMAMMLTQLTPMVMLQHRYDGPGGELVIQAKLKFEADQTEENWEAFIRAEDEYMEQFMEE